MTERNAIDGFNNTPQSTSLDNFRYQNSSSNQSSMSASPQKGVASGGSAANHIPTSNSYPNAFLSSSSNHKQRAGSPVSMASSAASSALPHGTSALSPASNSSYNSHKYFTGALSPSALNSVNSSMTSFHHTPTRSTLPTDYKQPSNGYGTPNSSSVGGGTAGWPPVRHTPSPAPSLPTPVTRSDSRNSGRTYESASLDRKDRKTYDNRTADYNRFSQTLGAAESRSLRRSKRGRANTPTIPVGCGGGGGAPAAVGASVAEESTKQPARRRDKDELVTY